MKVIRTALWAAARAPILGRAMANGVAKANAFWKSITNEKMTEIYSRYHRFTRLRPESYVANLEIIQRFAPKDGCVVECGVWRGGMSAGIADLLGSDRAYYLFDSFEGLPEAQAIDGGSAIDWQSDNSVNNCRTEEHYAEEAMSRSCAQRFILNKGWFNDTLKNFTPESAIAVLRLDADWYSSTAECLNHLYPHVQVGGLILIDDYFVWDGCSRAVHDYLSANALADRIHCVDRMLAYIIKTECKSMKQINPNRKL